MAASADNDKFADGDVSTSMAAGRSLAVQRLNLTDFRCYAYARVETDTRPVVLTGPNGAGKTNILEALSYLVPGRGLRSARLSEIGRSEPRADSAMPRGWAVAAKLLAGEDQLDVGTGLELDENDSQRERRVIKVDGNPVKTQSELGRRTSALWLTPQMDRLFQEGASGRRKFIDRLIYGLDPEHAGPVAAYEHSLRSRNKVLKDSQGGALDAAWLDSIEDSMARHGVAVALRRLDAVARLHEISEADEGPFPGAHLALAGEMEELVAGIPALDAEESFRRRLRDARGKDLAMGATSIGPHRSDLEVVHSAGGMPADLCSTGEQKALLVRIVLAAAVLEARERGRMPLLLLDEIGAHLDADRRAALFDVLCAMGAQAWMSGTDDQIFDALGTRGQFFHVKDARIEKR